MSTAAERAAAAWRRTASKTTRTPRKSADGAPRGPVRQTVDLTAEDHDRFALWRMQVALDTGRQRLTTQDALETLILLAMRDEAVTRAVRDHLEGL